MHPKFAMVFPGQGSQKKGMMTALAAEFDIVQHTFDQASQVLGYDTWQLAQEGPEDTLNQTEYTQPLLLAAGVANWRVWQQLKGPKPAFLAGHSLGEFTALVCAEVLPFEEAVALVQCRGKAMANAVESIAGAMAAVIGLNYDKVELLCQQVSQQYPDQTVVVANDNAVGQVVISGHEQAVNKAMVQAKASGAKLCKALAVSVPAHSPLMTPAAFHLKQALASLSFQTPHIPIVHNYDVSSHTHEDALKTALIKQIDHPVRWVETIQFLVGKGISNFFECGPGNVLAGLVKRIDKSVQTTSLADPTALQAQINNAVNAPR